MFKYFIAIALLFSAGYATEVDECDEGPLPINVDIEGCDEQPCLLVRGKDATMHMSFTTPYKTTELTPDVLAESLGISVHYPLSETDGCKALIDRSCPIEQGETVKYKLQMSVLKIFPKVPVSMTFTMKDQNNKNLCCFKVDGIVVDP